MNLPVERGLDQRNIARFCKAGVSQGDFYPTDLKILFRRLCAPVCVPSCGLCGPIVFILRFRQGQRLGAAFQLIPRLPSVAGVS